MISFLESFVVEWSYISLFTIVFFSLYLLYLKKDIVFNKIKKHKFIFVILFVLFILGSTLRIDNVSNFLFIEGVYYTEQAQNIALSGSLNTNDDTPSFPAIISVFMRIFQNKEELIEQSKCDKTENYCKFGFSSANANAIFGSLSIILIFILAQLLFKNEKVSLLSSLLLTFNPLHLEYSVKGYPPLVTSVFFTLLFLIILIEAVKINSLIPYIVLGLGVGFISQIYFIEIVIIIPAIAYIILNKGLNKKVITRGIILLLIAIISISPFIVLENLKFKPDLSSKSLLDKGLCIWAPVHCKYTNDKRESFINHIDNIFLSYSGFMFMGIGSKNSYGTLIIYDGWNFNKNNVNRVNDRINIIHIITTILIIIGLIYIKNNINFKKWLFLFLTSLVFIIPYIPNPQHLNRYFMMHTIVLMIPLVCLGIIKLRNILNLKIGKKSGLIIYILIIILLISPFLSENMIVNLNMTKGDNLKKNWELTNNIVLQGDATKCNLIPFKRLGYECTQWINVNNVVKNESNCNTVKDNYFEEMCFKRKEYYLELREKIEDEQNEDKSSLNNSLSCYDQNLLNGYCNSKKIPSERDIINNENILSKEINYKDQKFKFNCYYFQDMPRLKSIQNLFYISKLLTNKK